MPGLEIHRIRYFTALVKPLTSDPHTRLRQEIYIRALETLPNLTVHYGHYLQSTVSMPLAVPRSGGPRFADVLKMEEKGSDVNIATYMNCAFRSAFSIRKLTTPPSGEAAYRESRCDLRDPASS